ncbi:MAG: pseudouridine synthase, RluA family [Actinomycetia bacterium]|nr:pseudouridine synthase, RluA family [Actinomycetes bacterium]
MTDEGIPEPMRIPAALAGERVDRVVALLTGWSRADVQVLVERDAVLVGGKVVAKSHRLDTDDLVEVLDVPGHVSPPGPEPIAIDVVFEDADVIVVNKPAGLVVHPGAGNPGGTLVNGVLARYPDVAGVGDEMRPGIVHRLDRDTSGLLVVARSERAYRSLVEQLTTRAVERDYVALVWGEPESARGVIDAPIGRSESRRTRMAVRDEGRPARTRYEVTTTFEEPSCSLLTCHLETGRTHQIRVHLAAIKHPVVGDGTYGGIRQALRLERPFLHAAALAFEHPVTKERVSFTSPLPRELQVVLDRLERERAARDAAERNRDA